MNQTEIAKILDRYDSTTTECDGMTRICSTILTENRIFHKTFYGVLINKHNKEGIEPHFWIELDINKQKLIIDYRAKMWLGQENVPDGVFDPQDFPHIFYQGREIKLKTLSPTAFYVLTNIR